MKKRILFILGTRPEAIKVAPVYLGLKNHPDFEPLLALTGQQDAMADDILAFFQIVPDFKIDLKRTTFSLAEFTANCLSEVSAVIEKVAPDLVFVHGDTSSSFCGALAAYYQKIPVAHLEAGLRTYDKHSPFPEEVLRRMNGVIADYHFAPTEAARQALVQEHTPENSIHMVGNSVIDALLWTVSKLESDPSLKKEIIDELVSMGMPHAPERKNILITGHRRESFGDKFEEICRSIKTLAQTNPEYDFIYPVHLNPNVQRPVQRILDGIKNVYLIAPVNYPHFVYLMQSCHFILTDSGGIQEEAPSLGKPVLVMREKTERPEAIAANCAKIVGTSGIVAAAQMLIDDPVAHKSMAHMTNPYGDGKTAEKIIQVLRDSL